MKIYPNGLTIQGKPLGQAMEEEKFEEGILKSLEKMGPGVRKLSFATSKSTTIRDEMERKPLPDLGNPLAVGWTYLVNKNDPDLQELENAVRPLAEWRGMKDEAKPLYYDGEGPDEWYDWMQMNYSSILMDRVPYYILILGGPDQVPFHFQAFLDTAASVGRVAFDSLDDLKNYVGKIIGLEKAAEPKTDREAVFFAPDYGPDDATYFSHHYMASPLSRHVMTKYNFQVKFLKEHEATKANLEELLNEASPSLVYTASHGLGDPGLSLAEQKKFNGAICCQKQGRDWLFTADDVSYDRPFLEGAVFFQFACFGYGTPARSDFMHWMGENTFNAHEDFIAALPKKLLAHPHGPIAFIGHVDTAWLHGFDDPNNPYITGQCHPRISPFINALEMLLDLQPMGIALADMNKRYDICNALLTNTFDRMQKGLVQKTKEFREQLINTFITRSDAQNYMIFGDPAAHLRIR
ncbi:MAG: hypothetical protein JXB26_19070 [Candidatus Aminicenantes bacterium]|nr:hypothetical protein [Candidatus Aminicenantes bacterium]